MKACLVLMLQAATAVGHVHPSITTVYRSFDVCFQQDNASHHKVQIISNWFLERNTNKDNNKLL